MSQGGSVEVAGRTLTSNELMLKRGFKGDAGVFEAAVSEDGKLMVVLDTRKDEKVCAHRCKRPRSRTNALQKKTEFARKRIHVYL